MQTPKLGAAALRHAPRTDRQLGSLRGGVISATLDAVGGLAIALALPAREPDDPTVPPFPNIGTWRSHPA